MILNNAASAAIAQEAINEAPKIALPRKKISRSAAALSREIRAVSCLAVKDLVSLPFVS
jgi:hypothetical protein